MRARGWSASGQRAGVTFVTVSGAAFKSSQRTALWAAMVVVGPLIITLGGIKVGGGLHTAKTPCGQRFDGSGGKVSVTVQVLPYGTLFTACDPPAIRLKEAVRFEGLHETVIANGVLGGSGTVVLSVSVFVTFRIPVLQRSVFFTVTAFGPVAEIGIV